MTYLPKRDEFDKAEDTGNCRGRRIGGSGKTNLSMYAALSQFENDPKGFNVEDLKNLAGVNWDQEMWDELAKSSFDLSLQDQSPKMPHFDKDLGKWLYYP